MQDWKEQQVLREEQVRRLQVCADAVSDAVLEVYLEHLPLPPENQEH